jgi:hypothetical protein
MSNGIRWTVTDRYGNAIYLTEERWQHIIDPFNHPEVETYEEYLQSTLRQGRRRQEPLNPRKYRYFRYFDDLPSGVNHFIAIVLFGFTVDDQGQTIPNNYVATAFFKYIQLKR